MTNNLEPSMTPHPLGAAVEGFEPALLEALAFASGAHGAQRYGDRPYVEHLLAVVHIARAGGLTLVQQIAAALHDVLEDTQVSRQELEQRFGAEVGRLVEALSASGRNRRAKLAASVAQLRATPQAAEVKLADRIANIEASVATGDCRRLSMYLAEAPAYAGIFALASPMLQARLDRALHAARASG